MVTAPLLVTITSNYKNISLQFSNSPLSGHAAQRLVYHGFDSRLGLTSFLVVLAKKVTRERAMFIVDKPPQLTVWKTKLLIFWREGSKLYKHRRGLNLLSLLFTIIVFIIVHKQVTS